MNYGMYGPSMMNTMQPAAQNTVMSGSFRNVFGVIGGFQSLVNIFSSMLDILYFLKTAKTVYFALKKIR